MNPEDYLLECPDVDECDECGYAGEMICDRWGEEYWILCPRCDEFVFEGGEVPVEGATGKSKTGSKEINNR
jgi:hypothetical protein